MTADDPSPSPESTSSSPSRAPASTTAFMPMADAKPSLVTTFDTLLKKPGSILHHVHHAEPGRVIAYLLLTTLVCLAAFGLMTGWFSGGEQLWAAPVKIVLGTFAAALICLPSLYIFACLSGYDVTAKSVVGVLTAVLCLSGLLLLGFTPVVWVFSQSIRSLVFMGFILLGFWIVAMSFGVSLLFRSARYLGAKRSGNLAIWVLVFFTVSLQMSTSLRPIVGQSGRFFPDEKKFFLEHWFDSLSESEVYHEHGGESVSESQSASDGPKGDGGNRGWD